MLNLLYSRFININDNIGIYVPTVGEILNYGEEEYYTLVDLITAMPIDMMAQLDNFGIDFTEINEYELFILLFREIKSRDTSIIFGDLDLSKFELGVSEQNGKVVLVDVENDITIDREIHRRIANALRKIHNIEKNNRKPANEEAKKYLIQRAKDKARRHRNKTRESQIEPLIIAMVNTEQYKYNYETTLDLTVYQFNQSVRQVVKKVEFDNRMFGVYSGTVSVKDLSKDDLNWLNNK